MADENQTPKSPPDLSGIINMLSGNPELMKMASGILSGLPKSAPPEPTAPQNVDSPPPPEFDPSLFAKTVAPLLSGQSPFNSSKRASPNDERRCALLKALRPYLSPERRDAVDQMLKFSKLTDLLRAFDHSQQGGTNV